MDTPQQLPLNQFVLQLRHIVHCNQNFMDQVHIFESTYVSERPKLIAVLVHFYSLQMTRITPSLILLKLSLVSTFFVKYCRTNFHPDKAFKICFST